MSSVWLSMCCYYQVVWGWAGFEWNLNENFIIELCSMKLCSRIVTKFNFQLEQHKRSIIFFLVKGSKYMANILWRGLWIKLWVFWIFKDKSDVGSGRLCALKSSNGMRGLYTAMNWIEGFRLSELLSKWENNFISHISSLTPKM